MYVIVVRFKAKSGKELEFKRFLKSIIEIALESPDCLTHDLHVSLDNPGTFMFYESWESKEAHEKHIVRPEVQKWRAKLIDFLAIPYDVSHWERG